MGQPPIRSHAQCVTDHFQDCSANLPSFPHDLTSSPHQQRVLMVGKMHPIGASNPMDQMAFTQFLSRSSWRAMGCTCNVVSKKTSEAGVGNMGGQKGIALLTKSRRPYSGQGYSRLLVDFAAYAVSAFVAEHASRTGLYH